MASTISRIIESVWLATQTVQLVNGTGFLVVKVLVADIFLGRAFIDAIVRKISAGKQMTYHTYFSSMAIKGSEHEYCPVSQVDGMAKHSERRRVAKMVKTPVMSQIPTLVRPSATELQEL